MKNIVGNVEDVDYNSQNLRLDRAGKDQLENDIYDNFSDFDSPYQQVELAMI